VDFERGFGSGGGAMWYLQPSAARQRYVCACCDMTDYRDDDAFHYATAAAAAAAAAR